MKFSINRLYAFIAFCIIFNLACDDDDYPTQSSTSQYNGTKAVSKCLSLYPIRLQQDNGYYLAIS